MIATINLKKNKLPKPTFILENKEQDNIKYQMF